jgi:hypothetical protein
MTLSKPLAVGTIIVLGLALVGINNARREEDKSSPTVKPHPTAASMQPQGSGGQAGMQTAENGEPRYIAHEPQQSMQQPMRGPPPGEQWSANGDSSGRPYGAGPYDGAPYAGDPNAGGPYGVSVGGPYVYWAPGRWYPYPGFGDKRPLNMPPPPGVWSR